jgi:hypothetical protein
MNNADMPARPTQATLNREQDKFLETQTGNNDFLLLGLTKREHLAGLAMQGLMSNSNARITCLQCAEISVSHADALLAELDKVQQ